MIVIRCDHCKEVTNDKGVPFFQVVKSYRNEYSKLDQRAQRTVADATVVKVLDDIKIGDINIHAQPGPGQELLHVCAGCLGQVAGQGAQGIAHAQVRKEVINALEAGNLSDLSPEAERLLEQHTDFSAEIKQITEGKAQLPDIFKREGASDVTTSAGTNGTSTVGGGDGKTSGRDAGNVGSKPRRRTKSVRR